MVMTSYLQRLAARATGNTVAPSLLPSVRSEMISESESDPFAAASEPYELPVSRSPHAASRQQATSNDSQITASHQHSSEPLAASEPVALGRPAAETQSTSHESPTANGPSSNEIDFQTTPKYKRRGSTDETPDRANPAMTQTAVLEEKKHLMPPGKDEFRKPSVAPPREHVLAPPTRIEHGSKPFATEEETGDRGDAGRSNRLPRDVSQQIRIRKEDAIRSTRASSSFVRAGRTNESAPSTEPRPVDAIRTAGQVKGSSEERAQTLERRRADAVRSEERAQTLERRRADAVRSESRSPALPDVNDERAATLEPRRVEAVRSKARVSGLTGLNEETAQTLEPRAAAVPSAAPIPDEPRLVIGQLRVDVVAAAPSPPREVVRVVTHNGGSGRSSNTGGSLSKLRFGLGQM